LCNPSKQSGRYWGVFVFSYLIQISTPVFGLHASDLDIDRKWFRLFVRVCLFV
jgi:hypothetical protein